MTKQIVHIINHTHWDREWFLSCVYTTRWIPTLIDRLLEISAENPDFRYLLDGQTLIIEDLLAAYPDYLPKVAQLIHNGNLTIGPYYCQPDWNLTYGESLFRNIEYGQKDAARFGGTTDIGWLVDTFGHISQTPQIHRQFGINAAFVWRGMPILEPYFMWKGADGTTTFGVDLFGGYRNLYGVTHAPDVAETRLRSEIAKLSPYYPTPNIPLFDGYDLEDSPEDPVTFLNEQVQDQSAFTMLEATPASFVKAVQPKLKEIPTICGELNSGKYGATFPGVYSTRTYAKVMNRDCAHALYRWAEPLATLAWIKGRPYDASKYEAWARLLLQNDVHDVTCGVSIDQVHEKAEDIYARVFAETWADVTTSLATILADFAPGTYAVSVNPATTDAMLNLPSYAALPETNGIGVWPVTMLEQPPDRLTTGKTVKSHSFSNNYYAVTILEDGSFELAGGQRGYLAVYHDHGDSYSDETGAQIGVLYATGPLHVTNGVADTIVSFNCQLATDNIRVDAAVNVTLNPHELLNLDITLDSYGTNFRVEIVFDIGTAGRVKAGMPFDMVDRPFADTDLLPREVGDKAKIFMGQRELNVVRSFPFHDLVALESDGGSAVIFAKGINSYRAYENGTIAVTLRRSGEWVTRANLENRVGDAGPFFYVPDARCERTVQHQLAFAIGDFSAESQHVQRLNAAFQNPPLIVEWRGNGARTEWQFLQRDALLSSLRVRNNQIVARWYNPTSNTVGGVAPKKIVTETIKGNQGTPRGERADTLRPRLLNHPTWRVGKNRVLPDMTEIGRLHERIASSRAAMEQARAELENTTGRDHHLTLHQVYIHQREMLEYMLSARLNEIKLAQNGEINDAYLYDPDPEVVRIGWELNQLRIKRRIYDYVAAALR